MAHMLSNDSTRFRKACIFTTLTLRENTCTIASGDYSTPVSQRMKSEHDFRVQKILGHTAAWIAKIESGQRASL
jgi:hypothetical protein